MEPKDFPYLLLGVMTTLREDMKKTIDEMVDKGKVGKGKGAKGVAQADKAIKDLVEKGQKGMDDLMAAIGKEVTRVLDGMGAITKNDIRAIEKKISGIEKKLP